MNLIFLSSRGGLQADEGSASLDFFSGPFKPPARLNEQNAKWADTVPPAHLSDLTASPGRSILSRQWSLLRRRPGVCVWQDHPIRSACLRMRAHRRSRGIEGRVRFHGVGVLARVGYRVRLGCRVRKHSAVRHGHRTWIHSGMGRDRAGVRNSRTGGYTASANRSAALRPADRSQQAQHHPANQCLLQMVPPLMSMWESMASRTEGAAQRCCRNLTRMQQPCQHCAL